jgi:porphobilinogen deaminase
LIAKIKAISTREDALGVVLERQALSLVEGSCHLAIGALAKVGSDGAWRLMLGLGGSPKGWQIAEVQGEFSGLAAETVAQISKAPLEPPQCCCFEPLNGVP